MQQISNVLHEIERPLEIVEHGDRGNYLSLLAGKSSPHQIAVKKVRNELDVVWIIFPELGSRWVDTHQPATVFRIRLQQGAVVAADIDNQVGRLKFDKF